MVEQNKDSPQVAIAWMVLAGLCFSATGVFVKLTGDLLVVGSGIILATTSPKTETGQNL